MKKPARPCSAARARRRGFTLIELLAVITILSILIALLLPAIFGANRAARVQQVKTEITALDTAIKSFKQEFGIEPPSNITLCEVPADWAANPASQAVIARMWPQFDFTLARDLNGNGNSTDPPMTLNGSECLVLFLGGVFVNGEPTGFSRIPANPWQTGGTNRLGPFYEFKKDRILPPSPSLNPNFYVYADPISGTQLPYLYASSNDGQGYNEATALPHTALDFPPNTLTYYYRQGTETTDPSATPFTSPFWNKNGYQIISAGFDRKFGVGGPYQKGNMPIFTGTTPQAREVENDNITNFSDGLLIP